MLTQQEIERFIVQGYVRIDGAFPRETAEAAADILWNDLPCDRLNSATWTEPVIRLGMYAQQPFVDSVNTAGLHMAFDQLVGAGKWIPCRSVGTFPIRFPSSKQAEDTGRHVDASFPGDDPADYMAWRINIRSRGRALLMLVLYSDVTENDAPTIIEKGSHRDVARLLHPAAEQGLSFMELASRLQSLPKGEQVLAVGEAGTVYLCHPFLVHAAQAHRGTTPRLMAQPPLLLREPLSISDSSVGYTPVEQAIRQALE